MKSDLEAMAAESKRLRADRKRFDIEQLICDLRLLDAVSDPRMDQAVARVQKFFDEHR